MERQRFLALTAAALVWAAAGITYAEAPPLKGPAAPSAAAEVHEERIGLCDTNYVSVGPDGVHSAYAQRRGNVVRIIHDGHEGPEFPAPVAGGKRPDIFVTLSEDGTRTFCAVETDDGVFPVVDGLPGPVHAKVQEPHFSRDGRRLAYLAMDRGPDGAEQWRLVLDGRPGPAFDKIGIPDRPYDERRDCGLFSRDGSRTLYAATQGAKHFAVIDGKVGPSFDEIYGLQFGPDGRHTAYRGVTKEKWCAVIDGHAGPVDDIANLYNLNLLFYWSPDGSRVAYEAERGGHTRMVVDGKEGPEYDYMMEVGFSERHLGCVFSQDSQHFAYGATQDLPEGPRSFVVLDGKVVGRGYDRNDFRDLWFVGNRLLYTAQRGGKRLVGIDSVEGMEYDKVTPLRFVGPDRSRIVYEGRRNGEWFVVEDGREHPAPEGFAPPGPRRYDLAAGAHTAKVNRAGGASVVVVDGQPGQAYEKVDWIRLTDDGHAAYPAFSQGRWRMVLDGTEGPVCDGIDAFYSLARGGHLAYAARFGAKWRVVADGKIGPEFESIEHLLRYVPCGAGHEWVYVAEDGEKKVLVVGQQSSPPAKEIWFVDFPESWSSDDPPHWAARVLRDGKGELVFDGQSVAAYDSIE